jgi:hypothetical protein
MPEPSAIAIVVAALDGAAIGVERQWSGHAQGAHARLGGVRTFTLIGGAAGVAGSIATLGYHAVAIALIVGTSALVVMGYVAASRRDVDATTEAAGLAVLLGGRAFGKLVGATVGAMALAIAASLVVFNR